MSYSKNITETDLKTILNNLNLLGVKDEIYNTKEIPYSIETSETSLGSLVEDKTHFFRSGNTVFVCIVVKTSSSGSTSGSNIYQGTLTTTKLLPCSAENGSTITASLTGYQGGHSIIGYVQPNGLITIRNSSSTSIASYTELWLAGSYLVPPESDHTMTRGILQYYPVGSYYETSDSTFNPNVAWGGTWELKSNATLSENSEIITDTVSFTISRTRVSSVSVTAPNKAGYSFLCWGPTATNGWIGGLYPEYPRQQTTKFWVETSDGTSNTGNCDATAIYIKNSETIYRWHRTA